MTCLFTAHAQHYARLRLALGQPDYIRKGWEDYVREAVAHLETQDGYAGFTAEYNRCVRELRKAGTIE